RQTKPSCASILARFLSRSWLPAHPWMNSTPGTPVRGSTSWAASRESATGICSALTFNRLVHAGVFRQRPHFGVVAAIVDRRALGDKGRRAVDLDATGAHGAEARPVGESLEGGDLGRGGAADAPGLLQNAYAPVAVRPVAAGDVVIAAGRDQPGEMAVGQPVEGDRALDSFAAFGRHGAGEQRVEAAPHHEQARSAIGLPAAIVRRQRLGAPIADRAARKPHL